MDLNTQTRILELASGDDGDLVVLLGSPDPESAELAAVTVTEGDPTFAGSLAGVQLGLPVYHVLEEDVRAAADAEEYEQQIGLLATVLDRDSICQTVATVRGTAAGAT